MEDIEINKIEEEQEIRLKIQTLEKIFSLNIKQEATVLELKEKIFQQLNIPIDKQRLIFQGKLLNANEKLTTYKISNDNVVHLVAKVDEQNQNVSNNTVNSNSSSNNNNQNEERVIIDDIINLNQIPVTRTRRRRGRRTLQFDISESFESMHQNIVTINNLIHCQNQFEEKKIIESKVVSGYNLERTKYEVGQWVDIKDTIDQWLEAQILQVRENFVYVHYNGWGTRWDEWIEMSSPRIAPFKTYTYHSSESIYLSPYPSVIPDGNVVQQKRSIDTFYYLEKLNDYMRDLSNSTINLLKLRKSKNELNHKFSLDENQSKMQDNLPIDNKLNSFDIELLFSSTQLIPMYDRVGRLLSDMSLHLNHLLTQNNLYPQIFLGYNLNPDLNISERHNSLSLSERNSRSNSMNINTNEITNNQISSNSNPTVLQSNQPTQNLSSNSTPQTSTNMFTLANLIQTIQNQPSLSSQLEQALINQSNSIIENEVVQIQENQRSGQTGSDNVNRNPEDNLAFNKANSGVRSSPQMSPQQKKRKLTQSIQTLKESLPRINIQIPAISTPEEAAANGMQSDPQIGIILHALFTNNPNTTNQTNPNNSSQTNPIITQQNIINPTNQPRNNNPNINSNNETLIFNIPTNTTRISNNNTQANEQTAENIFNLLFASQLFGQANSLNGVNNSNRINQQNSQGTQQPSGQNNTQSNISSNPNSNQNDNNQGTNERQSDTGDNNNH